jgi:uncharacterized DUF497 family protein
MMVDMSKFAPRIHALDWDDWNRNHISKHAVTEDEVGEVISGEAIYRASYKNRIAVTGPTQAGHILTIVIGESPRQTHLYYVFSARPASRSERRDYQHQKGGSVP